MTTFSAKPGFALPAVLFIAVLGILFGFGRLLVFNNQCRLRLDRQQELEKVFAVRSALNRLQNSSSSFPAEGNADEVMVMHTASGRDVKVLIHPADAIFPIDENSEHFYVNRATYRKKKLNKTRIGGTRYRYGSTVGGDQGLNLDTSATYVSLMPTNAAPGDICRLSLDMSDTGRWSDDPHGRRYAFNATSICGGTNVHDLVRLILRRKRPGEPFGAGNGNVKLDKVNDILSWLPSQDNESVIYAELLTGGTTGSFTAWTRRFDGGRLLDQVECVSHVVTNTAYEGLTAQNSFGIQLVGRRLTLFQAASPGNYKQYNFAKTAEIPEAVYFDFTNDTVRGESLALSTNMVMELEIVASSARNPDRSDLFFGGKGSPQNRFDHFEVYPAFEFAINIENKRERWQSDIPTEPILATVVHLEMDKSRASKCTAITYDTHGTEIKGWRTGERMSWGLIR